MSPKNRLPSVPKYLRVVLGVFLLPLGSGCTSPIADAAPSTNTSAPASRAPLPLRALLVGGGPTREQSQAGVEANVRYVASLLDGARSTRLLWADGLRKSPTVATLDARAHEKYLLDLAWSFAFDEDWPEEKVVFRAPNLPNLNGASSQAAVKSELSRMNRDLRAGETALLYFTGHGSPGSKSIGAGEDQRSIDDFDNTIYWHWNDKPLSVRTLSPLVQALPARNPIVLVMVQCHSGGFGNIIFQNGDPKRSVVARDICGFFATSAERQSSGCTPAIDEASYQDFTTHFFAALSGRGRANRRVLEADFDGDNRTSMLEAFAYANLHDLSIDVPGCTSQILLKNFFPGQQSWFSTPFSRIEKQAAPWQRAILRGLSARLKLSGESRLQVAWRQSQALDKKVSQGEDAGESSVAWPENLLQQSDRLKQAMQTRIPRLKLPDGSPSFARARDEGHKYLRARPEMWRPLAVGIEKENARTEEDGVRAAMLWRFAAACFTLIREEQLRQKGTQKQISALKRLRQSESRALFAP